MKERHLHFSSDSLITSEGRLRPPDCMKMFVGEVNIFENVAKKEVRCPSKRKRILHISESIKQACRQRRNILLFTHFQYTLMARAIVVDERKNSVIQAIRRAMHIRVDLFIDFSPTSQSIRSYDSFAHLRVF